jgi:hypothetical protein
MLATIPGEPSIRSEPLLKTPFTTEITGKFHNLLRASVVNKGILESAGS